MRLRELAGITMLELAALALLGCGSVTAAAGDGSPSSNVDAADTVDVIPDAHQPEADLSDSAVDRVGDVDTGHEGSGDATTLPIVSECSFEASGTWSVQQCAKDCTKALCTCTTLTTYGACSMPMQLTGCPWNSLQADGPGGRGQFYCPTTGPDAKFVKPACVERCP